MKFETWSIWHFLYMISSFVIIWLIYLAVRNKSEKTKYIVGIIIGILNIAILLTRNIDIYIRNGWDLEVIPLQVCHIGNIIVGLGLITKKKWLTLTGFCFNFIPALSAMVFADGLANYNTILKIRPQAYIWGHILICVGAIYSILIYKPKFEKRDFIYSIVSVVTLLVMGIICNSLFRYLLDWEANYFYIFNAEGTPFGFIYNLASPIKIGWFEINIVYTLVMLILFALMYIVMYLIYKFVFNRKTNKQ